MKSTASSKTRYLCVGEWLQESVQVLADNKTKWSLRMSIWHTIWLTRIPPELKSINIFTKNRMGYVSLSENAYVF